MQNWNPSTAMSILLTLGLGPTAIYIILSGPARYGDEPTKWAYGIIGTLIGFWLRH
jgi:hypothetical protein